MLAQFSIWPLDNPHMSKDIADITTVLDQCEVEYEVGPMGTTVTGEWQDVMDAIHACCQVARRDHQRVLTTIMIDDDATRRQSLHEGVAKVAAQRGN